MKSSKKDTKNFEVTKMDEMDLVCFAHLRWNHVFQRPHHLMTRCAKERRVFFVQEPEWEEDGGRVDIQQTDSGLHVVTPVLSKGLSPEDTRAQHVALIEDLFADNNIQQYIAWYYTPMALSFTYTLKPALTVYDCMDELSAFNGAPPKMLEYEEELLRKADIVFTGGQSLYEAKRDRHHNVHAFPSSIDGAHFRKARQPQEEPIDQIVIPHPRLGYFGVIDERIDYGLLEAIATARPDWHLVMVGPLAKVSPKDLPKLPNIHYLNQKQYKDLPVYLAGWDVALMPFALNRATQFISPTKTPEYLAGGKPVVSTPIRDVVRPYGESGMVHIAQGPEAFIQAIETCLADDWDRAAWLKKVDKYLSQISWDYTWARMMQQIEAALSPSTTQAEASITALAAGIETALKKEKADAADPTPMKTLRKQVRSLTQGEGSNGNSGPAGMFDYLIVGAGFAGSVLAERLANGQNKRVLVIDRRNHIGGNAYDMYNEDGLLIHKYGPHIFHTNSREVFEYLSRFTDWRRYEHRVLASVDGQLVPIPINLDTINQLYGLNLTARDLPKFYESVAEPRDPIRTSEDVVISKVGRELYEKFFRNYTRKQWDLDPSQLDASVTSRVPIRMNRDNRYFSDTYQSMPVHGYTRMFERLLDHPNIKVMLNTDYREIAGLIPYREMIFTGPVDEYFDFVYGKLPYRSLEFKFETLNEEVHQPVAVINYPNEHLYTRVTEVKYLTGQKHPKTSLVYEYPTAEGDPYYPIPRPENAELYKQYQKLASSTPGVHFAGRLATYKYYNMDQVVAQALALYARIAGVRANEAARQHTPHFIPVELPGAAERVK